MNKWWLGAAALVLVGGVFLYIFFKKEEPLEQVEKTETKVQESTQNGTIGDVNIKQYQNFPGILPEGERKGKSAKFSTNMGTFTVSLFGDKAPKAVSNFIFLAKDGFYNNVTFHRVIADFMIQGGDPQSNGAGGPGYRFEDEFDTSLTFAKAGVLAMANSGPNTNGSQFFVTVASTLHLNNKHTIFGQVTNGMDVVEKVSKLATDPSDRPLESVIIQNIEIF